MSNYFRSLLKKKSVAHVKELKLLNPSSNSNVDTLKLKAII